MRIFATPSPYTGNFQQHEKFNLVVFVGCTFMLSAGYINALSVVGLYRHAITHMSGLTTSAAARTTNGEWNGAWLAGGIIICFAVGAFVAGLITGGNRYHIGKHYALVFAVQSVLLYIVFFIREYHLYDLGQFLIGLACGLQNGATSNYSNNMVRSTHITGMVNDVAMACAHYVRWGESKDLWRMKVFVPLYLSFLVGGMFGTAAWNYLGYFSLLVPSSYSALAAIVIVVLRLLPDGSEEAPPVAFDEGGGIQLTELKYGSIGTRSDDVPYTKLSD